MTEHVPQQILRLRGVTAMTGLSRSSLYKYIGEGTFPAPVQLGRRSIGFYRHEIEEWLANRVRGLKVHAVSRAVAARRAKRPLSESRA